MFATRIALADEHRIVLTALSDCLEKQPGLILAHVASSSAELFSNLRMDSCEIVMTDFYLGDSGGPDGLQLLSRLRKDWPSTRIVLFTALTSPEALRRALALGVSAVVSKRDPVEDVVTALQHVRIQRPPFFSSSLRKLGEAASLSGDVKQALTSREIEVLRFIGEGVRLTHIANRLGVSISTVATHKANAMRKLGVVSDALLVLYAQQNGLTQTGVSTVL